MLPHSSQSVFFLETSPTTRPNGPISGMASSSGPGDSSNPLQCLEQINDNLLEQQARGVYQQPSLANYYNYNPYALIASAVNQHLDEVRNYPANSDSGGQNNKKAGGRQTYNAEQKRTLEDEFQRSKYVSKAQRMELKERTQLTDKQIKIWFQNRRMKKKKQDHQHQGGMNGGGEMTQESSPSFSPPNGNCSEYQQQQRHGGMIGGSDGGEMLLANVKSEPENGIGIKQESEIAATLDQQQQQNNNGSSSGRNTYPNLHQQQQEYSLNSLSILPQQLCPTFPYASAASYYQNPYYQQAFQAYQQQYPVMAAASNWHVANAAGYGAEMSTKIEGALNGGGANH